MASLSHRSGRWVLSFYTADKRKRSLWLGEMSKRAASNSKRHIEELVRAQKANIRPEADTELWIKGLQGRLREALAKLGLCEPEDARLKLDECRLLGPFMDAYVKSQTDAKPNTISNYKQAIAWTVNYFGRDRILQSITESDVDKLHRHLKQHLAESTVTKHMKRLRTMLRDAVRARLLDANPAVGIKLSSEVNRSRDYFVTPAISKTILEACPSMDWKLIFALPRYAGLRCPTEVHGLKWTDVDWAANKLRIDSVKTGLRFCPMFEPLRSLLTQAWEDAPVGGVHVVRTLRDHGKNLRTQLNRIIEQAGLVPWEKPFVNLRATRRTELERLFPSHVINAWLGQSTRIAERHYLQVTEEDWSKAASLPVGVEDCSTGASIPASQELSEAPTDPEEPLVFAGSSGNSSDNQYPRKDSNLGPAD